MCLNAGAMGRQDAETETLIPTTGAVFDVTHSLRGEGFDASEDGTGRGTPLVPVPFDTTQITSAANYSNPKPGDQCHPLARGSHAPAIAYRTTGNDGVYETGDQVGALTTSTDPNAQIVAFSIMPMNSGKDFKARETDVAQPIMAGGPVGGNQGGDYVKQASAVRRLTPRECERLQGFPDDFTLVPYRNKPAADGPRYKALGNSMAVPVMSFIGHRIQMVEDLLKGMKDAA